MMIKKILLFAALTAGALAAPMPQPSAPLIALKRGPAGPVPTKAPFVLPKNPTPNDLFRFYGPIPDTEARVGPEPYKVQGAVFDWLEGPKQQSAAPNLGKSSPSASQDATPIVERDDNPPVPTSQLPYPTFPAQYASCPKCEANYSKISSCAQASSAFQNGTTVFSDPTKYYSIIKCACTDTFQAVYPQCLDCFQHTNQCWYLGTDPQGSGAPAIISNMRSICALGSALLGGVASTNQGGWNYTYTPSDPGYYTDVSSLGPGYIDQSTGPIFRSAASSRHTFAFSTIGVASLAIVMLLCSA